MRYAALTRNTKETQIRGTLRIDGHGKYKVSTGIRFLDHMLELFTKHGGFDLKLTANGDLDVDQHHTVEDLRVQIGSGVIDEAAEEVFDQLGLQIADEPSSYPIFVDQRGAAA